MRTTPKENADSDHNLVFGNIRLLERIAPNRPKRVIKNRRAIDLPRLMADPHLPMNLQEAIAAKFSSPIPGTNTGSADNMTSVLTKTIVSNAADIAPLVRRKRSWMHDGRIGKTRGNGFVLLQIIVVYTACLEG